MSLIETVGLARKTDAYPHELSGGEKRRVAIASALMNDPPLLLADEPTGNLDSSTEEEILNVLDELHLEGRTLVVVTHDDAVAERASRVIQLKDGLVDRDVSRAGKATPSKPPISGTKLPGGF